MKAKAKINADEITRKNFLKSQIPNMPYLVGVHNHPSTKFAETIIIETIECIFILSWFLKTYRAEINDSDIGTTSLYCKDKRLLYSRKLYRGECYNYSTTEQLYDYMRQFQQKVIKAALEAQVNEMEEENETQN